MSIFNISDSSLLDLNFTCYAVIKLVLLLAFIIVGWCVDWNRVAKIFLMLGPIVLNVYQFLPYSEIRMMIPRLAFAVSASSNLIKLTSEISKV